MKLTPGPLAAEMSGSIGGTTFSRNRYGAYTRVRAIPVIVTSTAAMNAKARLANVSAAWRDLTAAQKLAWNNWAVENPITDALGQRQALTGHAAYVGINTRLHLAGDTLLTVPPVTIAPDPLLTLSGSWDIGAGNFALTFTTTPLGADDRLFCQAAVVDSAGINFVENRLKLVKVTAKAQATGLDLQADIEARFGTLAVGQKVIVQCSVFSSVTGLLSTPMRCEGTVVTTP